MKTIKLSDDVRRVVSQLEIDGNVARITRQLPRPLYEQVNEILVALGGKWTRREKGHLFDGDAADKIENVLLTGEIVDLKKSFDFFETPPEVTQMILDRAEITNGMSVLEPSAGHGAIADAVKQAAPYCNMDVVEAWPENRSVLRKKGYNIIAHDFLKFHGYLYDRIVMNPPFSKQQDITHVLHAWDLLDDTGRLVAIMSSSVTFRDNALTNEFKRVVKEAGGEIEELPEASFKASGTMVNTVIVTMARGEWK